MLLNRVQFGNRSLRACLAGLGIKPWSSATNGPTSRLRRVTVHVHRTTATHQLKLYEPRLTAGTQIRDRLRKTNSAKQASIILQLLWQKALLNLRYMQKYKASGPKSVF